MNRFWILDFRFWIAVLAVGSGVATLPCQGIELAWDPYPNATAYALYVDSQLAAVTTNHTLALDLAPALARLGLTVFVNGVESLPAELTVEFWEAAVERAPGPSGPWRGVVTNYFPVVVTNGQSFYRSVVRPPKNL